MKDGRPCWRQQAAMEVEVDKSRKSGDVEAKVQTPSAALATTLKAKLQCQAA